MSVFSNLVDTDYGLTQILSIPDNKFLLHYLSTSCMNRPIEINSEFGSSVLFKLTLTIDGLSLLVNPENQFMLKLITAKGLFQMVSSGDYKSWTPLHMLCFKLSRPNLYSFNPLFTKNSALYMFMLSTEGINAWNQTITHGSEAGKTPMYFIASDINSLTLISSINFAFLIVNIYEAGLNQPAKSGKHKGISLLFWLVYYQKIIYDPIYIFLIDIINPEGLNTPAYSPGKYQGTSALFWILNTSCGIKLLKDNPSIVSNITSVGLNTCATTREYAGQSPLLLLCLNKEGIEILLKHPEILLKVNQCGLHTPALDPNHPGGKTTAFYEIWHNPKLRKLVQNSLVLSQLLIKNMTLDGLNHICTRTNHSLSTEFSIPTIKKLLTVFFDSINNSILSSDICDKNKALSCLEPVKKIPKTLPDDVCECVATYVKTDDLFSIWNSNHKRMNPIYSQSAPTPLLSNKTLLT